MPGESGPENREPENSMDDERFYVVYKKMERDLSPEEVASFVEKYSNGGMDFVRMKDAQKQEKQELLHESRKELKKQIPDMTNEELYQHYIKIAGGLSMQDAHIGDPFSRELFSRLRKMEQGEGDREYSRLESLYGKDHKEE